MLLKVTNTTARKKALRSASPGVMVVVPAQSSGVYDLHPSVQQISLPGLTIEEPGEAPAGPPQKAPSKAKPAGPAKDAEKAAPAATAPSPEPTAKPAPAIEPDLAPWQKGLDAK
jgi:hypothetical protein